MHPENHPLNDLDFYVGHSKLLDIDALQSVLSRIKSSVKCLSVRLYQPADAVVQMTMPMFVNSIGFTAKNIMINSEEFHHDITASNSVVDLCNRCSVGGCYRIYISPLCVSEDINHSDVILYVARAIDMSQNLVNMLTFRVKDDSKLSQVHHVVKKIVEHLDPTLEVSVSELLSISPFDGRREYNYFRPESKRFVGSPFPDVEVRCENVDKFRMFIASLFLNYGITSRLPCGPILFPDMSAESVRSADSINELRPIRVRLNFLACSGEQPSPDPSDLAVIPGLALTKTVRLVDGSSIVLKSAIRIDCIRRKNKAFLFANLVGSLGPRKSREAIRCSLNKLMDLLKIGEVSFYPLHERHDIDQI